MKLGTETGSVINHLLSRGTIGEPVPEVGMGATLLSWTDRAAATIVEVVKRKDDSVLRIGVQQDVSTLVGGGGLSESQTYEFYPNPKALVEYFTKNRKGQWVQAMFNVDTGRWVLTPSAGLRIGDRATYSDPSF